MSAKSKVTGLGREKRKEKPSHVCDKCGMIYSGPRYGSEWGWTCEFCFLNPNALDPDEG